MRTVTNIAQDAMNNFTKMLSEMSAIANGNDEVYSEHWPDEENLFPPLLEYINKNRELKKELERLYANVL